MRVIGLLLDFFTDIDTLMVSAFPGFVFLITCGVALIYWYLLLAGVYGRNKSRDKHLKDKDKSTRRVFGLLGVIVLSLPTGLFMVVSTLDQSKFFDNALFMAYGLCYGLLLLAFIVTYVRIDGLVMHRTTQILMVWISMPLILAYWICSILFGNFI